MFKSNAYTVNKDNSTSVLFHYRMMFEFFLSIYDVKDVTPATSNRTKKRRSGHASDERYLHFTPSHLFAIFEKTLL